MLRVRQPETVRLNLADREYLIVKKYLTAGEYRRMLDRIYSRNQEGKLILANPIEVGRSQMMEYLVDWSATGPDGKPLVIRDKSPNEIGGAVDLLPYESFQEIRTAVERHMEAMEAEVEAEKNERDGEKPSSGILPSAA